MPKRFRQVMHERAERKVPRRVQPPSTPPTERDYLDAEVREVAGQIADAQARLKRICQATQKLPQRLAGEGPPHGRTSTNASPECLRRSSWQAAPSGGETGGTMADLAFEAEELAREADARAVDVWRLAYRCQDHALAARATLFRLTGGRPGPAWGTQPTPEEQQAVTRAELLGDMTIVDEPH